MNQARRDAWPRPGEANPEALAGVVITGIGLVGPHGVGLDGTAGAALAGQQPFTAWPEALDPPHAQARIASVGEYPKARYFNERQLRLMDKAMSLSAFAAGTALEDAGYADGTAPPDVATLLGTVRSEQPSVHKFLMPLVQGKPERINPAEFPQIARNISCGQLAIRFGLRGPSSMLASGSLSALEAIGRAAAMIRLGRCEIALAGGVEVLSKFSLYFTRQLQGPSEAGGPSFFGAAAGLPVPSEGACMLVLESAERARARGARVHARVGAWQAGRLGRGPAAPALRQGWSRTLERSGIRPADLGLVVSAAGGGRRTHEAAEAAALADWFGEEGEGGEHATLLHAPRSLVGEGEAWASALQVASAARALSTAQVLPTLDVAADAPVALRRRAAGGALPAGHALVVGGEPNGGWCALTLGAP